MPTGLSPHLELPAAAVLHQSRYGEELQTNRNLKASEKYMLVAERFGLRREHTCLGLRVLCLCFLLSVAVLHVLNLGSLSQGGGLGACASKTQANLSGHLLRAGEAGGAGTTTTWNTPRVR